MQNDKDSYPRFDYNEHAKTLAPDDFLGQVKRTVKGEPVAEEQIKMIVDAIQASLRLKPDDKLLELACGNGAVSRYFFDSCADYLGVDISEYLISVAKTNFERLPHYRFVTRGAAEYVRHESHPEHFSKDLCYAGFCFFPAADAIEVLHTLYDKFINVQTLFIGNLPDKDRAAEFYKTRKPGTEELSDHSTAIGTWRTREEFKQMAAGAGWKVEFSFMPKEYYAGHYRYDAQLSRY
ncbi:MAG: class I SAM-dependent methyltransferase [Gallionella sp.]|nr:class I SAM-dependent methyltransferase [Gallionella sp.]